MINRKVRGYLIEYGLLPDEKQQEEDALRMKLEKINTKSPYRSNRPRVKYFEKPEKIKNRINMFRRQVTMDFQDTSLDLEQMLQNIHDDQFINDTFESEGDGEQQIEVASVIDHQLTGLMTGQEDSELEREIGENQYGLLRLQTKTFSDKGDKAVLVEGADQGDDSKEPEESPYEPQKFTKMTMEERDLIREMFKQNRFEGTLGSIIENSLTV